MLLVGSIVATLSLLAAGCSGGSGTQADQSAESSPTVPGLSASQVDDAVNQLDEIVQGTMSKLGTPGVAVAVVQDDRVVTTRTYGVRSTETQEPVNEQTLFQIASLSKPISGTIVSGLSTQGGPAWDDLVRDKNPSFRLKDPWVSRHLTYADLVSMRAGLPGQGGNLLESIGFDQEQIMNRLRLLDLNPFRDSYEYSNFSLTSGAVLAADAAGMSWDEAAQDVLFDPAGMKSTSYNNKTFEESDNTAQLHVERDGAWRPLFERTPDAQAPAGGVNTNITDMATWGRVILGGGTLDGTEIVAPDVFTEFTTLSANANNPSEPLFQTRGYGLGINVGVDEAGNTRWNHSGAFSTGAATTAVFLPAQNVGIIVLTNAAPVGASESITDAFMEQVTTGGISQDWDEIWTTRLAHIYGEPEDVGKPTPGIKLQNAEAFVGTYRNAYVGDFEVTQKGGGLVLIEGPARVRYRLKPWRKDTFVYAHAPELPDFLSTVTFTGTADRATSMDVSAFDEVGWGTLRHVG